MGSQVSTFCSESGVTQLPQKQLSLCCLYLENIHINHFWLFFAFELAYLIWLLFTTVQNKLCIPSTSNKGESEYWKHTAGIWKRFSQSINEHFYSNELKNHSWKCVGHQSWCNEYRRERWKRAFYLISNPIRSNNTYKSVSLPTKAVVKLLTYEILVHKSMKLF